MTVAPEDGSTRSSSELSAVLARIDALENSVAAIIPVLDQAKGIAEHANQLAIVLDGRVATIGSRVAAIGSEVSSLSHSTGDIGTWVEELRTLASDLGKMAEEAWEGVAVSRRLARIEDLLTGLAHPGKLDTG